MVIKQAGLRLILGVKPGQDAPLSLQQHKVMWDSEVLFMLAAI